VKGKNKYITGGEVNKSAYIKTQSKITDYREKGATEGQKDELVKPDDFLTLRYGIAGVQSGICNILIDSP
jgi:hypothetical protein